MASKTTVSAQAPTFAARLSEAVRGAFGTYALVVIAFLIVQGLIATGSITSALQGQLVPICVYICAAVSLNLVVGISGELSLGHAGFMSVGAFTGVVMASLLADVIPNDALRLWCRLPPAAASAPLPAFWWACPSCACPATTSPS